MKQNIGTPTIDKRHVDDLRICVPMFDMGACHPLTQLAPGVPDARYKVQELEGTMKALPSRYGADMRTLKTRNTVPPGTWPLSPVQR